MRTRSMIGGPWTRSMIVVHGPGPRWESMDPWSILSSPAVQIPAARFPNDINTASSSGASFGRGAKQVTGDEPQGTMGRVETTCLTSKMSEQHCQ